MIWKLRILEADWAWSRAQSSLRGQELHAVANATVVYEIVGRGRGVCRIGFVQLDDGDSRGARLADRILWVTRCVAILSTREEVSKSDDGTDLPDDTIG